MAKKVKCQFDDCDNMIDPDNRDEATEYYDCYACDNCMGILGDQ